MRKFFFLSFILILFVQPIHAQLFPAQQYLLADGEALYLFNRYSGFRCADFSCSESDSIGINNIPREVSMMAVDPNGIRSYLRQSGEILRCTSIQCGETESGSFSALGFTQFWDRIDYPFEPLVVVFAVDRNGFPVLIYRYEQELHFVRCNDVLCAENPQNTILPPLDRMMKLRLQFTADNLAVLTTLTGTYTETQTLSYLHCLDTHCQETSGYIPLVSGINALVPPRIVIAENGDMFVAFADWQTGQTYFAHCQGFCQGYDSHLQVLVAATTMLGIGLSADGFPVLALMDTIADGEYGVYFMFCNDADCTGGDERLVLDNVQDYFPFLYYESQFLLSLGGIPAVLTELLNDYFFFNCQMPNCDELESIPQSSLGSISQSTAPLVQDLFPDGHVSAARLLYSEENLPVIAYYETMESGKSRTVLLFCENSMCVAPHRTERIIDDVRGYSNSLAFVLDADGNPLILYQDRDAGMLYLARCLDNFCEAEPVINLVAEPIIHDIPTHNRDESYLGSCLPIPDNQDQCMMGLGAETNLVLDAENNPVIVYTNNSNAMGYLLHFLHCDDSFCTSDSQNFVRLVEAGQEDIEVRRPILRLDADGNPMIAVSINREVRLIRCDDANCSGSDEPFSLIEYVHWRHTMSIGFALSPSDNLPVFAYNADPFALVYCADIDCASIRSRVIYEYDYYNANTVEEIQFFADGDVLLNINNWHILRCDELECSPYLNFFDIMPADLAIVWDRDGKLNLLASTSISGARLLLYHCPNEICEIPD